MSDVDENKTNLDPSAQDPAAVDKGEQEGQPEKDGHVPYGALKEEREKRQALQAELEIAKEKMSVLSQTSLNNRAADPGVMGVQGVGSTQYGPADPRAKLDELWETDPRRAMQTEMMMGFGWYDNVNAKVEEQMDDCSTKYKDFTKYRGQVRKYIRNLPIQERMRDGVSELAYFAVRGQNADKVWEEKEQELLKRIRAGEKVQGFRGTTSTSSTPTEKKELTDDEHKVAEALGMSAEEYQKHKR